MERYGSYEVLREIGSGYGTVVYAARRTGETEATFAVKVFSLDPLVGGGESESALDPLLRDLDRSIETCFETQKKAAAFSPRIAPILEHGKIEHGEWYATRLFPLTLQKLIAGRVALDKEGIFHVVSAIVQGTLDIKRICGRPHGNLKPGNVLIGGAKKITETEILLTDPLQGEAGESASLEISDLRKTGEILYQLVKRKEIEEGDDTLALSLDTPEWSAVFGKQANAWREICGRLLDPHLSAGSYSLEKLEADLKLLAPKPPVSPKVLIAAVAVVCLIAGGVLAFMTFGNKGVITLSSDPPSAEIYMNGNKAGTAPLGLKLPKGNYTFEARVSQLSTQVFEVSVEGRQTQVRHAFRFDYGNVVVLSKPPGAKVRRIDAGDVLTDVGVTPYTNFYMVPGESLKFRLDLDRHESEDLVFKVPNSGATTQAEATLQPVKAGEELVEISSGLPGQRTVTLNGGNFKNALITIPIKKSMPSGTYEVTAVYPHLQAARKTAEVGQGKANKLSFDFDYAIIDLKPEPAGAEVWNGQEKLGLSPTNILWQPGEVQLEIRAEGFYPQPVNLRISSREKSSPTIVLKRKDVEIVMRTSPPVSAEVYDPARPEIVMTNIVNGLGRMRLPQGQFNLAARSQALGSSKPVPLTISYGKEAAPITYVFNAGVVALSSDPPGATFFLDTNSVALGPNTWALTTGSHALKAEYPDLEPVIQTNLVAEGSSEKATLRFQYGSLVLLSEPSGVQIAGRGIPVNQKTPYTNLVIRPSDYSLTFTLTNKPKTRLAKVRDHNHTQLLVNFSRPDVLALTNKIGMEFVYIRDGLYFGRWEVSQAQYAAILQTNSLAEAASNAPAVFVSPANAKTFCELLTKLDDAPAKNELLSYRYDVPTLEEWRLAAGSLANADIAASVFNNSQVPLPILGPRTSTNSFGLYDMFGNVSEWCVAGNEQWMFIGGSVVNAKPTTRFLLAAATRSLWATPVTNAESLVAGFRETGFRCVLREVK